MSMNHNQKPKPFRRPGISLSDGTKREWRDVPVETLKPEDMVQGKGLVVEVKRGWTSPDTHDIRVTWKNTTIDTYALGDIVHAFVRV